MLKTFLAIGLVIGAVLYLSYGTLSPCGVLRETVRQKDGMAAILPDGLVDAALVAQYGALNPGRCIGILFNGNQTQVAAAPTASRPTVQQPTPNANDQMKIAVKEAETAILECRSRRLSGELKTYLASAQCANPRIIHAFSAANYRYMDLIGMFTLSRAALAEKIDRNEITEVQAQAETARLFSEIVDSEKRRDGRK
jgi:hypothetical protein